MTTIEWTDQTWNPVTGCTKVSQGCKHCYAERVFPRTAAGQYVDLPHDDDATEWPVRPRRFTDVVMHHDRLEQPLHWRKPRMVFVNSMSDLFHEDVPDEFIDKVFAVMALCPQHTFQVLTKRPERMLSYLTGHAAGGRNIYAAAQAIPMPRGKDKPDTCWPFSHVWLGVSVEDQETADERIPLLLQTPAAMRFVSYEPALGPVDFTRLRVPDGKPDEFGAVAVNAPVEINPLARSWIGTLRIEYAMGHGIDWLIIGGESGPKARPCDVQWARDTIAQCKAAGVPVFVKQLGACVTGQINHEANEGYGVVAARLDDRKGGDPSEWPEDLRVREYPA
jgi:protein gp37